MTLCFTTLLRHHCPSIPVKTRPVARGGAREPGHAGDHLLARREATRDVSARENQWIDGRLESVVESVNSADGM